MDDTAVVHDLDVLEIVFSCGVCQATVSDVYANRESNKGFHSNSGDDDGVVTRMWIADCTHLFCGKHLPGGAAPFHRQDSQPEAACPQCIFDVHDDSPRKLYGIRGFRAGEFDAMPPRNWLKCPPAEIEASSTGMEAVRFQYVALARFAQKTHARCKAAEHTQAVTEAAHSGELDDRKHAEAELQRVQHEISLTRSTYEKDLAQLRKWQKREGVINHYLGIVPQMAKDLAQMRAQLADLGYVVPARDYQYRDDAHHQSKGTTQLTAQADVAEAVGDPPSSNYMNNKRHMIESLPETRDSRPLNGMDKQRTSSRDLMPPPFSKPSRRLIARDERRDPASSQIKPVQARHIISQTMSGRPTQRTAASFHAFPTQRPSRPLDRPGDLLEHAAYTKETPVDNTRYDESMQIAPAVQSSQTWDMPGRGAHRLQDFAALVRHEDSRSSRVRHYGSVYGTVAAQRETQDRESVQLFSGHVPYARPPTTSPDTYATPQRPNRPPQSSVISPFFHRSGVPSSDARMDARVPSQQSFCNSRQPIYQCHSQLDSEWRDGQQVNLISYPRSPDAMSRSSNTRSVRGLQPDYHHDYRNKGESWRPPGSHVGDVRATGHRPHLTNPYQRLTASRSRITLPPSSSQISDAGLSHIRGVRGTFGHTPPHERVEHHTGLQASRGLFTANGRRSVRR
ncbi:hypothetical protein LTR95_002832 [Oleoguttula sp. CCFEE 5521]